MFNEDNKAYNKATEFRSYNKATEFRKLVQFVERMSIKDRSEILCVQYCLKLTSSTKQQHRSTSGFRELYRDILGTQ